MSIPKTIIQIGDIGEKNNQLLEKNQDYEYIFFQESDCINFLKNYYPPIFLNTFKNIIEYHHKSELFRYCYLYKKGGIYIDIDLQCIKSFNEIIEMSGESDFISSICSRECNNGFIMTSPNNIIFKDLIGFIIKNINPIEYNYYNKHLFITLNNPNPYQQYILNGVKVYLFKEVNIEEYNYIIDEDGETIINSNDYF